jgi:hypothetical protein
MSEQCFYCGENPGTESDHIISQKAGGPDEQWNFVMACKKCNSRKGSTDLLTYLQVTACYEEWNESKRTALMEKLAIALMRGFINQRTLIRIKTLIYPKSIQEIQNYNWGTIQSCGVGIRSGEKRAIELIAEAENQTKNSLMHFAIRRFIEDYIAGKVTARDLEN